MSTSSQLLEAIDADGHGLRAVFSWNGDRYSHSIEIVSPCSTKLFAESIEGNEHDQWPPSAPLQQLTIEDRPHSARVALLVGMAGHSHWSASVTATRDQRSLLFEMACRTSDPTADLSSSYLIDANDKPTANGETQLRWPGIALATPSSTVRVDPSSKSFRIRAPEAEISGVATIQWAYALELLDPPLAGRK